MRHFGLTSGPSMLATMPWTMAKTWSGGGGAAATGLWPASGWLIGSGWLCENSENTSGTC